MPIYDYECRSCDTIQELTIPFGNTQEIKCVYCGNVLFKVFSANPIHFKGSGWAGKSVI
jgi:putative FmdB family regulatory protein